MRQNTIRMECITDLFITDGNDVTSNVTNNRSIADPSQKPGVIVIVTYSAAYLISLFSITANIGLINGLKKTNKILKLSQKLYILSFNKGRYFRFNSTVSCFTGYVITLHVYYGQHWLMFIR